MHIRIVNIQHSRVKCVFVYANIVHIHSYADICLDLLFIRYTFLFCFVLFFTYFG